jgi:hypothetical protein
LFSRASLSCNQTWNLVCLPAEGASLGEPGLSSGRLAEHGLAARAHDNGLGVAEHSCTVIAEKKVVRILSSSHEVEV